MGTKAITWRKCRFSKEAPLRDVWEEGTPNLRLQGFKKLASHARHDLWIPNLEGTPIAPRRRVLTPIQESQAQDQAKSWADKKVIEPIKTPPLLNNLVLVAKKDGRIRVCVDCTPANKVTQEFNWPLPRLQDIRYQLQGQTCFSRLDLKDAFFRIGVPLQYRHLTAFCVGGQSYQFTRMPFGLKTAPAVFQRFMDRGLSEFSSIAFWYIDDILIYASSMPELKRRERMIRRKLKEMKCDINEGKSESSKNGLLFAGMRIFAAGVGPDERHIQTLRVLPAPNTKAEAQSALGLVSYLRDFIPLMSHFTALLYPDKQGLRLDNAAYHAEWGKLIRHMVSAVSITHHWKEGVDADLYTDASQYALGAVIIQDGCLVAVASRKLSPAETRYSATDREHLGLVFAAEKFRFILHQSSATVRVWSDHSALVTRSTDRMTPRQARWHTIVSQWMPKISHVKGCDNPADYVSRWKFEGVGGNF